MRYAHRRVCTVVLVLAAICVTPVVARAQLLSADMNGDGSRDRIEVGRDPAELIVRISNRRIQRLRAGGPIVRLVLADVDHDGDADLVASTSRLGLHIWRNRGDGRLVRLRGHSSCWWRPARDSLDNSTPRSGDDTAAIDERRERTRVLVAASALVAPPVLVRVRAHDLTQPHTRLPFRPSIARGPPSRPVLV